MADRQHAVRLFSTAWDLLKQVQSGRVNDLDELLHAAHAAVTAAPTADRGDYLVILSQALVEKAKRTNAVADWDAVLATDREVWRLTAKEDRLRSLRGYGFQGTLLDQYDRIGDLSLLDEAIEVGQVVVASTSPDDSWLGAYCGYLGRAYHRRFEVTRSATDLDAAIAVQQRGLDQIPADDPNLAVYAMDLARYTGQRYVCDRSRDNFNSFVEASRTAVAVAGPEDLVEASANLASALLAKVELTSDWGDLDESIALLRHAVSVAGHRHPRRAELLRALSSVLWLATEVSPDEVARIAEEGGAAIAPTATAARVASAIVHRRLFAWRSRRRRAADAWSALEAGRNALFSEIWSLREDLEDLRHIDHDLWTRVRQLRQQLDAAFPAEADLRKPGYGGALARQSNKLVYEVASRPGLEHFGLPPDLRRLRRAARGGTVVALNVHIKRGHALVLSERDLDVLTLPGLTHASVVDHAVRLYRTMHHTEAPNHAQINDILGWLWEVIAEPVLVHLGHVRTPEGPIETWPRIWWNVAGDLSFLPLHAAGHCDSRQAGRSTLDRVINSYTQSVRALDGVRRCIERTRNPGKTVVVGIDKYEVDGVPSLKNAEREATAVSGLLGADRCLLAEAASRANVINELSDVGVLHLACHAVARQADPAGSHLVLQDGRLTIDDLLGMELPLANLAYLSACSTALGLGTDVDEVDTLHIAAAFQAAGFPNVIGTLWPVTDVGAQKLAIDVHRRIADGVAPAHALHAAVRAARDAHQARPDLWSAYLHYGP